MNIRKFVFATALAVAAVSCGKVSEMTEISGKVNVEGVTEVRVLVENVTDTIVPVTDGSFHVAIPADVTTFGRISAGSNGTSFISDGTPLTVVIDQESAVTSKYPKISIQERMNSYNADEKVLMDEYMGKQREIYGDSLLSDTDKAARFEEYFDEFIVRYRAHHVDACKANTDNFVSVLALNGLRGELEDEEMASLVESLSPALQENRYVKSMKKAITARIETAEGKMFTDFTVNSVVGMTRSIPPQPKYAELKFSDFVGKGKYVLVDFWSPWCGPCRREMPNIKAVYEQYKDKGLEVLSLAVWERKEQAHTIEVAGQLGMDWLHMNNCGSVPTDIYGVEGIPHLMLIGPDGTILKRGFHGLEGIQEAVSEYLK